MSRLSDIKQDQISQIGLSSSTWIFKTSAYLASRGNTIGADTSGGSFTITLPSTPAIGDQIFIGDTGGMFATNNLTVARNGELIAGIADDYLLDINSFRITFVFQGGSIGWAPLR